MVAAYRAVKGADGAAEPEKALSAALPSAWLAGRAIRALEELSLVQIQRSGEIVEAVIAASEAKTDLDLSFTFRSYSEYKDDSERWLRNLTAPTVGS
jgi:hypothetical protein